MNKRITNRKQEVKTLCDLCPVYDAKSAVDVVETPGGLELDVCRECHALFLRNCTHPLVTNYKYNHE